MSIESPETIPGPQTEVAVQVGKTSPRNRSRTRRAIMVGGAILLSAGFAFFLIPGFSLALMPKKDW
jgi:hypothetical protein